MIDAPAIYRKIAEDVYQADAIKDKLFNDWNEASFVDYVSKLLLRDTDLPKMVKALQGIAKTETKPPEFKYGGPSGIRAQCMIWYREQLEGVVKKAQQTLPALQGDKPVEETKGN